MKKAGKRRGYLTRHHIVPQSRKGTDDPWNILHLYHTRHEIWHRLFGNRNIPEIIALLKRVQSIKEVQYDRISSTYHT